jgi:beta-ketoacyl-acyl-carrier-protein synthase II
MNRRVVITGIGAVTPLGNDMASTWQALVEGRSAVAPITRFDASPFPVKVACEVKGFEPAAHLDPREARRMDPYEQYAVAAAKQAVRSSGLEITPALSERTAVVVGSAIGGISTLLSQYEVLKEQGPRRVSPFCIPMVINNGGAGMIAIELGVRGPCCAPVSACATSNDALGQATELIRRGAVTAAVAGGADATVQLISVASFDRLGALSHDNSLPPQSPRPFDKDRDGVIIGEGACVMVLEELDFARARGAAILAEVIGYGQTTDAFHVIAPSEGGVGAARAIRQALDDARVSPADIDYINAHGTATPLNDVAEAQAIKSVFGDQAARVPISGTKSMTGHLMGAAGAIEAAVCVHAMRDGVVPGTRNLRVPDPACAGLDLMPNETRRMRVDTAMNNSFGFGGHNSVIILRRYA